MYVHAGLLRGALFLVVATSAWGGMFAVAKKAITDLDPVFVTMVRYTAVSIILIFALCRIEGSPSLSFSGRALRLSLYGVSGIVGFNILALYGLKTASPEVAATIMVTLPFLSSVVKRLIDGTPMRVRVLGCMMLAITGVSLVVTKGSVSHLASRQVGGGELLVLLGAVFWAIYTVGREKFRDWSALRYSALSTCVGSVTLILIWMISVSSGALNIPAANMIGAAAAQLWYLVLIAGVIAIMAWAEGVERVGAVNASLFMCFVPITAFAIEMAGGYRPQLIEYLGVLLTMSALFLNHYYLVRVEPQCLVRALNSDSR